MKKMKKVARDNQSQINNKLLNTMMKSIETNNHNYFSKGYG